MSAAEVLVRPGSAPFDAVVFDFDGTLVDSNGIKRVAFFEVAEVVRPGSAPVMRAALEETVGDRRTVLADYARRLDGSERQSPGLDWLVDLYGQRTDAAVAAAVERPGAGALLEQLRLCGIRLFLSSATPLANLQRIVEARGWSSRFEALFGRPSSKVDSLASILARSGLAPRRLVVVGDGPDDRDSARDAGCAYRRVDGGVAHAALADEPLRTLCDIALECTGRRLPPAALVGPAP